MGTRLVFQLTLTIALCALCGALGAADAAGKGSGPVACSKGVGNDTCVPAACPKPSNGKPCRDPKPTCKKKKRKKKCKPAAEAEPLRPIWPRNCNETMARGQLMARDNNGDGILEYSFAWGGPGIGTGQTTATFDGEHVVPDKPIPLIAAMAVYGGRTDVAYAEAKFLDRMVCARKDASLRERSTEINVPKKLRLWNAWGVEDNTLSQNFFTGSTLPTSGINPTTPPPAPTCVRPPGATTVTCPDGTILYF